MNISNFLGIFANRKYELWVVHTKSEAHLYLWKNWKHIYPFINTIVNLSSSKAFIRTYQVLEHRNNYLGFGRMTWNKNNNEKWTKKYREKEYENSNVTFFNTQIWVPDWNHFCDKGVPPDIFIQLYNYPSDTNNKEGIVIALTQKIYNKNTNVIESALNNILNTIPNSILSHVSRSWWSSRRWPNEIQDINSWELAQVINKSE